MPRLPVLLPPALVVLLVFPVHTGAQETTPAASAVTVTAEQWARPRRGDAIAQFPELSRLVEELDLHADSRIVLRHPGGDEGLLWAEELRSWLVALGVPSARIELAAAPAGADRIALELRRSGTQP